MLAWMAWTWQTALFFCLVGAGAHHSDACWRSIGRKRRASASCDFRQREAIGSS